MNKEGDLKTNKSVWVNGFGEPYLDNAEVKEIDKNVFNEIFANARKAEDTTKKYVGIKAPKENKDIKLSRTYYTESAPATQEIPLPHNYSVGVDDASKIEKNESFRYDREVYFTDENGVLRYRNTLARVKSERKINKSEEIYVNYNELAGELATTSLKSKYKEEYDEEKMTDEWAELVEKLKNIIFKHERTEKY